MARFTSATKATSTASNAGRRSRATSQALACVACAKVHYVGQWKDGNMHGEGTLTGADGSKYVGQWKDDNMHGFGTSFFADGTILHKGEWANGKPVRTDLS